MVGALESAVAGESAVVIVGGEAGVGKTRLVEEAAARAREAGARVLMGSCIELGGAGLPLSPLVDAIRPLVREMDPFRPGSLWPLQIGLSQCGRLADPQPGTPAIRVK
jgi:predicted ATPase